MTRARPASTIVLMRPSMQILFLRRSRKSSFFPNAWVFPGGRVDDADSKSSRCGNEQHLRVGLNERELKQLRMDRELSGCSSADFAVAACRETFEEAGVWLGMGQPREGFRDLLNAREVTLFEDPSLNVNLERLDLWSWWITPEQEPKRYDTWFFISFLAEEEAQAASQDDFETVDLCWLTAQEAVIKHEQGEFFLAPPTYITLRELMGYTSIDQVRQKARERAVLPIMPIHQRRSVKEGLQENKPLGVEIILPGHPEHPDQQPILEGCKIVLGDRRWFWSS